MNKDGKVEFDEMEKTLKKPMIKALYKDFHVPHDAALTHD